MTSLAAARPVSLSADVDGRRIAWVGFVAGASLSVAANVAHAEPTTGARIAGAAWPLMLLLAFEVLTRVRWRPSRLRAFARYVGATSVAVVAAVMSYRHMAALLGRYGEDGFGAHLGPLAVDGLMVVCGAALLSTARTHADQPDNATADSTADEHQEPAADTAGPVDRFEPPATAPAGNPVGPDAPPAPARPVVTRTRTRTRTDKSRTNGPDITDLLEPIGAILDDGLRDLGRDQLAAELRRREHTCGGARKQAAKDEYDRQAAARQEVAV